MITVQINSAPFETKEGTRVIDAVRDSGIDLPVLCYKREAVGDNGCDAGTCRACQVEIDGRLATSCEQVVKPGMQIETDTPLAIEGRRFALNTIAESTSHISLDRPLSKQALQVDGYRAVLPQAGNGAVVGFETPAITFYPSLCIACERCVEVCPTSAIGVIGRGINKRIGPPPGMDFAAVCIACGQCTKVCPTGALVETSSIAGVEAALANPEKRVVFQIAPSVRVALGEEFGMPPGEVITGKVYAALRQLGATIDAQAHIPEMGENGELTTKQLKTNVLVTDTNVGADLCIVEEGSELIRRMQGKGKLPIITSCCPAWIKYMETFYPELRENVCSAKSPMQMLAALTKTYGARAWNIEPKDIVTVAVMPCTAKKYEAQRAEMNDSGTRDMDFVVTTRELSKMLKERGIDLAKLQDERADFPFEEYTGAGTIFGNTGGVMEAALRTVHKLATGEELEAITFKSVRGMESVKQAPVSINGLDARVAVLHNLNDPNVQQFLDNIAAEEQDEKLAAIEIMACPGGCVGGGGQPKEFDWTTKRKRISGLNADDKARRYRRSHESPVIRRIYAEFLEEPNSEPAHKFCHTEFEDKSETLSQVKETAL